MSQTFFKTQFLKMKEWSGLSFFDSLIILFIISLIFPIRNVFLTQEATILGQYSDFTSFSLYLSDILLFSIAIIGLWQKRLNFQVSIVSTSILISIFVLFIGNFDNFNNIFLYRLIKWVELVILFEATIQLIKNKTISVRNIAYISAILLILTSLIGLLQVLLNHSLGLKLLGESVLAPNDFGVAKIVTHGTKQVRAYGTLPHPNLLGAWLLTAFSLTTWWKFRNNLSQNKYLAYISGFLIITLILTFSRSSIWAFLAFSIILTLTSILLLKSAKNAFTYAGLSIILIFASYFMTFSEFQNYRNEESLDFRLIYNEIAITMISDRPFLGLGFGQSILNMNDYTSNHLEPWDIQPIHNYFVLSATELGIPMTILLLVAILYPVYLSGRSIWNHAYKKMGQADNTLFFQTLLGLLIFCFFLLMQTDHYFYTLQQGTFLLWIVLGIYYGNFVLKKPLAQS